MQRLAKQFSKDAATQDFVEEDEGTIPAHEVAKRFEWGLSHPPFLLSTTLAMNIHLNFPGMNISILYPIVLKVRSNNIKEVSRQTSAF